MNDEINALLAEQRQAFESACSITPCIGGERVQSSQGNSSENKMLNYIKYSEMIDDYIDKLYAIKCEILQAIRAVEKSSYRTILILRYIRFMDWGEIASTMNYSERQITNLHGQALAKVSIHKTLP